MCVCSLCAWYLTRSEEAIGPGVRDCDEPPCGLSLCSSGWPQALDLFASASQVLQGHVQHHAWLSKGFLENRLSV